jgi:hypothetical protein
LTKTLQDHAVKARAGYDAFQVEARELDSEQAKKKYTDAHRQSLKREKQQEAVKFVREKLADMRRLSQPALAEIKRRWTKSALLKEIRFAEVPDIRDLEEDARYVAEIDLIDTIKSLRTSEWAKRLDDESLLEAAEDAQQSGDLAVLGTLASEAKLRGKALVEINMKQIVDRVEMPEVDEAVKLAEEMELAIREAESLEYGLTYPTSETAQRSSSFFNWNRKKREAEEAEARAKAEVEKPKPPEPGTPEYRAHTERVVKEVLAEHATADDAA